ncbi:thioesterase family protein [Pontibacter sp. CAU 1760]
MIQPGDTRTYDKRITQADFARFEDGLVHAVCSTFALAQAAEWAGRLFVLELKAEDEEGIGTYINIRHLSPAFEGETLHITATLVAQEGNAVHCSFSAQVADRVIARGETGQKILKKDKLANILAPRKA